MKNVLTPFSRMREPGRRGSRRGVVAAGLAVTLSLAVAACGSDETNSGSDGDDGTNAASTDFQTTLPDSIVSAAEGEGEVYVYSIITEEDAAALTEAFNKVYPDIKLTFDRRAGLETVVEAEVAANKPVGDVLFTSVKEWLAANEDLLEPIQSEAVSSDTWQPFVSDDDRAVQFYFSQSFIAWNTSTVPDGIEDIEALADRGDLQLGMGDPKLSAGVRAQLYLAAQDLGDDWLKNVLQGAKFYDSSTSTSQALASNEIDVAWPIGKIYITPLVDEGAPIDSKAQEPSITTRASATILASAPHPNATQVFVDFLLSEAGQEAIAQGKVTPYEDIPGSDGQVPADDRSAELLDVSAAEQDAFLEKVTEYSQ